MYQLRKKIVPGITNDLRARTSSWNSGSRSIAAQSIWGSSGLEASESAPAPLIAAGRQPISHLSLSSVRPGKRSRSVGTHRRCARIRAGGPEWPRRPVRGTRADRQARARGTAARGTPDRVDRGDERRGRPWPPRRSPAEGGLEREIGDLLDQERFDPPEDFVKDALITDTSVHEEAAKDPAAWWTEQAKELLDWFEEPEQGLDDDRARRSTSGSTGGKINVSLQLPGPPRRRRQRRPRRLPLARRGGRGARRHLRRPAAPTSSASPTR